MKKSVVLMLILIGCLLSAFSIAAQSSPDNYGDEDDTDEYLKEKAKSHALVKGGALSFLHGELPIYLEMGVGRRLAIEIGAGVLMPWYIPELGLIISKGNYDIESPGIGYSLFIQGKKYHNYDAPFGFYTGIFLGAKYYNVGDNVIRHTSVGFSQGIQWAYKEKFLWDVNFGLGFHEEHSRNSARGEVTGFSIPILVKFGYVL
ncbi:hypothetical protein N8482_02535 [Chitinophagales bacterium]|nr:hypothetical protein [Chitinophagales bacterium]